MHRTHFYVVFMAALAFACGSSEKGKNGGASNGGSAGLGGAGGTGQGGAAGSGTGGTGVAGSTKDASADVTDAQTLDVITVDGYRPPAADAGCTGHLGDPCTTDADCCFSCDATKHCTGGIPPVAACTADGAACSQASECCSGICGSGNTCSFVTTSCKTLGNPCATNGDCCSKLCSNGLCEPSSYCTQPGDICRSGSECCSGVCNLLSGQSVGTCAVQPSGNANCTGVDGTVCGTCGDCCSRLCAPGPQGVFICQPASGCKVTGDVCSKDSDCCGGESPTTGLPGAGNVTCVKASGATVGVCGNNKSCNPQGNICHYQNYYCSISSASNDCCSAVGNSGTCIKGQDGLLRCNGFDTSTCNGLAAGDHCSLCMLDEFGIPRCNGLAACVPAGGFCSSASDCCSGLPCVPDAQGVLRCGTTALVQCGGACTVNADCVVGATCVYSTVGSIVGTCTCPSSQPDGSPSSGCALYGQSCTINADCCSGVPCSTDPATGKQTCTFVGG